VSISRTAHAGDDQVPDAFSDLFLVKKGQADDIVRTGDDMDPVCFDLETGPGFGHVVCDEKVHFLLAELFHGLRDHVSCLCAEAHDELTRRARGNEAGEDVRGWNKIDVYGVGPS